MSRRVIAVHNIKPWSNGPASSRKWTCVETCVGWPNGLASFVASTRKWLKKTFQGRLSSISFANNCLMDVTQLALTWFGWPNGEKLALTCDQSERKSSQVHARPGQTESQVDPSFQLAPISDSVWPGLLSAPMIKLSVSLFLHFRKQYVFPGYLAKFQSITKYRTHDFEPLFLCIYGRH